MSNLSIFILAVGLSMDALSVAIALGASRSGISWMPILRLSLGFGVFQFAMPILGWLIGGTVVDYIGAYDHWVAFGLLLYVGLKMIHEAFRAADENDTGHDPTTGLTLLMLSVATSIDALAVGLSLALLKTPILYPSAVIGLVCFVITAVGMLFGRPLGMLFGRKVEILGGVVLIGIGVRILAQHMF
ncbi:MAG: manganese efflux pump MntP family protein [Smithellaceae bacterium]|nr:manganese efflux pump MntP family protein [Smithellaceae bacterium]